VTVPATAPDLDSRAAAVLAGGATHAARTYRPPIRVARARGSRKWLVDGRELIDYTMGHGALLLGHAHPAVVAAVQTQVENGTHFGAPSVSEVEWAEHIVALVEAVEQVRFTSSGTEAAMLAVRLARAATGRDRIAKFDDHFHGWYDAVTVNLDAGGHPVAAAGVPATVAALTRVVRAGDGGALAAALSDRTVAAVVIEASGAHYGHSPLQPGFVAEVRQRCDETGALLIIDEVVTGFRVARGGMQELLDIRPDLSFFGKVMAGGLPGGAVGGRGAVMEFLSPAEGHVVHPGTFNANPLTAAAGIATLDLIADGAAQARASAYAEQLELAWRRVLSEAGVAGRVWRLASIIHCALDDPDADAQLSGALRERGVDLLRTSGFCSTAHDDRDLADTVAAFAAAVRASSQGRR
jgi:glutamate-1-semialdehyde 2,1-aminomutase